MKNILIFTFLLHSIISFSQRAVNKTDILKINAEIEAEIIKLKDSLINANKYLTPNDLEFKSDVYRIENLADKKIEIDYSTAGMSKAVFELEKGYDKLLNKYYLILSKKLKPEDREKLKISQRNWLKFRDSERILIGIISKDEYYGGGTIQSNIRASSICEITKIRVYEIKEHIDLFIE